jgi:quercetin dioxygenase-like cupin family protein
MNTVSPTTHPHLAASFTSAPVTWGAALTFETVSGRDAGMAPMRLRPQEDVLMRVISGVLRLVIDDEQHLLGPGAEAIIPAGAPHWMSGAEGEARFVMGLRTRAY